MKPHGRIHAKAIYPPLSPGPSASAGGFSPLRQQKQADGEADALAEIPPDAQHDRNACQAGLGGAGGRRQDGLLGSQIFLNGFYAIAGIGDAHSVDSAQFVMHQQFAHRDHLKIRLRHAPELARFQRLLGSAASRLVFCHGLSCTLF
jgi:hypothetical protein